MPITVAISTEDEEDGTLGRKICCFSYLSVQEYFEKHHWSQEAAYALAAFVCLKVLISTYGSTSEANNAYMTNESFVGSNANEW